MGRDMTKLEFLKESLKNLKSVGTITRSSKYTCKRMLANVDFETSKVILEFGAGDGVITKEILKKMRPDAVLYTFEINEQFFDILNEIDDPRLRILKISAEDAGDVIAKDGHELADVIISAIPFVSLPSEVFDSILEKSIDILKPGSHFIQLHYSKILKKKYEGIFDRVDVAFVSRNLPPCFVLTCTKAI